jgi:protein-L-isoaspartate(D-aspartate) O-methyltransferase
MVEDQIQARNITDSRVVAAMAKVPRHCFVLREYLNEAYADYPLPIGHGQTIAQPYVVTLMTQHLALSQGTRYLKLALAPAIRPLFWLSSPTRFIAWR